MKFGALILLLVLTASCSKGGEAPQASKKEKVSKPVGRGMIIDPRKAKPMLDRAQKAAAAASAAQNSRNSDRDAVK